MATRTSQSNVFGPYSSKLKLYIGLYIDVAIDEIGQHEEGVLAISEDIKVTVGESENEEDRLIQYAITTTKMTTIGTGSTISPRFLGRYPRT